MMKRPLHVMCAVACAGFLSVPQAGFGQEKSALPLWEIGAGMILLTSPEYPGASSNAERLSIFPYLAYRGKFLQINDQETFRLVPFRTDRLEFALSVDSAPGSDRRENPLRGDLPDLDPLAEFGPEIIWRAADTAAVFGDLEGGRIELALQTRGVFSINKGVDYEGFVVRPALRYRQNGALKPGSRVEATLGPIFGSQGVQDYFYTIEADDDQVGYEASQGYMGTEFTTSFRYPITQRTRLIGGLSASYLGGAASHDSPAFDQDFNASVFLGFTYSLFQSKSFGIRDR